MSNEEKSAQQLMLEGLEELNTTEEVVTEETQEVTKDEDPYEAKARKMGWRPKEELGEDFDSTKFVEAGEFIRRQELFDKISHETKARKQIEQKLDEITKYVKSLTESEFNREIARRRAERQIALEQEDLETVERINDEISDLQATKKVQESKEQEKASENQIEEIKAKNQEILGTWVAKNRWFNEDMELREQADDYAEQFSLKNPDKTLEELLEFVDKKMAKFVKPKKEEKEVVEEEEQVPLSKVTRPVRTTRSTQTKSNKYSRSNLDSTQRHMLDSWILPNKIMTEQEYIESLVAMGEVAVD